MLDTRTSPPYSPPRSSNGRKLPLLGPSPVLRCRTLNLLYRILFKSRCKPLEHDRSFGLWSFQLFTYFHSVLPLIQPTSRRDASVPPATSTAFAEEPRIKMSFGFWTKGQTTKLVDPFTQQNTERIQDHPS